MPRQYVSPDAFNAHPIGVGLNSGSLAAGVLDKVLFRASNRVDRFCHRKIGNCGTTTLSATVALGATQVQITSALSIDGNPDTKLQIGSGATQELVRVGGLVSVSATAPYAATVNLYPGTSLAYGHNKGEAVQQFYYEQYNPLGSATSKMDQYFDFTQAGQIAEAHAPRLGIGDNVRVVFLRNMPILQIAAYAVAYPWANVLDQGTVSDLTIANAEGWIRTPIGYFLPPDSLVHVTYDAGYLYIPDAVQEAAIFEAAAELAMGVNYLGAAAFKRGDYSVTFTNRRSGNGQDESTLLYSQEAQIRLREFRVETIS